MCPVTGPLKFGFPPALNLFPIAGPVYALQIVTTVESGLDSRMTGLDHNPLDLVQPDFVRGPVVELGRPRGLVARDELRVLDRAAVLEVGSNPGRPEGVATDPMGEPGSSCSPFDHP